MSCDTWTIQHDWLCLCQASRLSGKIWFWDGMWVTDKGTAHQIIVFVLFLFVCFETGSHYVVLAVLELSM